MGMVMGKVWHGRRLAGTVATGRNVLLGFAAVTVPGGVAMSIGTTDTLRAMITGDPHCILDADDFDWYVTMETEDVLKATPLVGTGQCVPLVEVKTGAPNHTLWRKGPLVKDNEAVPAGTAIAAGWDANGLYPSHPSGNHAAIYLSATDAGLVVVDQFRGINLRNQRPRMLRFGDRNNAPVNDGNAFHIIVTPR